MTQKYYNIIFRGKTAPGFQQEAVKQKLAAVLKLGPEHAGKLFAGKPVLLAKNIDQQIASKYNKAFKKAGAICETVPVSPTSIDKTENKTTPADFEERKRPENHLRGTERDPVFVIAKPKKTKFGLKIVFVIAIAFTVAGLFAWNYTSDNIKHDAIETQSIKKHPGNGKIWPLSRIEMVSVLASILALSLLILTIRKRRAAKSNFQSNAS